MNTELIHPHSPEKNVRPNVVVPQRANTTLGSDDGDKSNDQNHEEAEVEKLREANRLKEPFFYCKLIVKYPKTVFGVTLSAHLTMLTIMGILFVSGYDILPINFETLPLDIRNNKYYLRGLAWDFRNEDSNVVKRATSDTQIFSERSAVKEVITWFFQKENGNVLTKEHLTSMKAVEDQLFQLSQFQNSFCHLNSNGSCYNPVSILRFFDGTYQTIDSDFYDPNFNNIVNVIYKASTYNETKTRLYYHLNVKAVITSTSVSADIVRSYYSIGSPLGGYSSPTNNTNQQNDKVDKFLKDEFIPLADQYFKEGAGSLNFVYNSETILQIYVQRLVFLDMALVIGSFFFIFCFMWFQTHSLWVTGFAVLSINTGFCATNLVYRLPFDFRYFGIFHVLSLFIILGIGADDVFVFFDTWKESSHYKYKSLSHRLSDCYRRSALAMMYTSLTTAVAFLVSATSPFLAVNTFGVFTSILILVNYISVIVYFPSVIILYHLYFDKYKCCCCCEKNTNVSDMDSQSQQKRKNIIVRFFNGPYFRFVTHKIGRWVIIGFYTVLLGVFIYLATRLQVQEEQIKFLPDSSNFGKFLLLRASSFDTGEEPLRVFIIFGLKQQDLSSCHRTDSVCYGTTVWDDNMDINIHDNQVALQNLCSKLKALSSDTVEELKIKRSLVTNQLEITCFLDAMDTYYSANPNVSFTYNQSDAEAVMNLASSIYDPNSLGTGFTNWYEIVQSYWLFDGFQSNSISEDFLMYNPLVGETTQTSTQSKNIDISGNNITFKYGNRMRYAAIVVNTTINPRTLGYPTGIPIREAWEDLVNKEMASMPSSMNGFQTTPWDYWTFNIWHWLEVQKSLVNTAIIGIIVGLCLALPILIVATMNVFIGLMATLTIACITISVIGVLPVAGWKLGVLESLNLVLVVGLSVDYCVHLAEGYSRSVHKDRKGRVRDALTEVGISVISGCCTTLGASFFLMFAQILFFTEFGAFMFCTIGFSILYSLGLFITLLGMIGPENDTGSLWFLIRKIKCCRSKAGENQVNGMV